MMTVRSPDTDSHDLSIRALPRRRMHRRLWRLLALMIVAQAAASAIALLLLQGPWRDVDRPDHGVALAELASSGLASRPLVSVDPAVQRLLDQTVRSSSIAFAVITDSDDRVVRAGEGASVDLRSYGLSPDRPAPDPGSVAVHAKPLRGIRIAEVSLPGEMSEPRRLVVGLHDLGARRAVYDGSVAVAIGALVALAVPLPLVIGRFRSWTSSLHDLHAAIRRLSLDLPLKPVRVGGDDETAYLSIAFNDMASKLTAGRRALVTANQTLERRVADRTAELHVANTTLERQNEKLEELTDTALRFTDDVAHEFRTPLSVIMEFASIMSDGIGGAVTDEQAEYLRFISGASKDLSRLVDDFLDSSKLRARSLRVERGPHQVEDIIDAVWPMLQARARSANVSLERRIDSGSPGVFADAEKAGRCLVNLTVNALKFSGEGTTVTVAVEPSGSGARISVIDRGPGLAEDERATLFERFKQTGGGRIAGVKGFGLGLCIVRELVSLNLGSVALESVLGEGSTFSFTLPGDQPEAIVEAFLDTVEARAGSGAGAREIGVLHIAADARDCDTLAEQLSSTTYPMDVQLPLPDGSGVLLLGETGDIDAWQERLVRDCLPARRRPPDGGEESTAERASALRVVHAETYSAAELMGRVLSHLSRLSATQEVS